MTKIHYHPCPQALGEYNYMTDTIILHSGLKKYKTIHEAILKHEQEHAKIFRQYSSWIKRLALNIRLDYKTRVSGATKVPLELLRELTPSTFMYDAYQALYLIAYIPILVIEGIYYSLKDFIKKV